ncbi:MAG: hypothetical protein HQM14_21510 [SAR324 cluster bacterium]|nr:hypothetical protein [SAR324 cluster bacterium]
MSRNLVFVGFVILLTFACSSELKLSVEEGVWVGQDIKCSITGTWQEISWFMENRRVGKCEGQTTCLIPATRTGKFRIKVEVKNNYKSAFEPAVNQKKEKTIYVTKTDPDLIGKWGIKEVFLKTIGGESFIDILPAKIDSDPAYAEKLEITRDEYIITLVIHGLPEEKRYTADQDSGNELTIFFNGIFIREETYTLNGNSLSFEYFNSSGDSVKKVYEKLN